jgi:hypothetical protein
VTRRLVVRRPAIRVGGPEPDPGKMKALVEEAVSRLDKLTDRDEEFLRRFGKWRRPEHLPKYPIEAWANTRIYWSDVEDGIVEAAPFVRSFPEKADRILVGEVARFCAEAIHGRFATDETMRIFRLDLLRRLDDLGF